MKTKRIEIQFTPILHNKAYIKLEKKKYFTKMMKGATITVSCAVLLLVAQLSNEACAFSFEQLSRRESLQALIGGVATAIVPSVVSILPALAAEGDEEVAEVAEVAVAPKVVYHSALTEETPRSVTRMGGLLVGLSSHSIILLFAFSFLALFLFCLFCSLTPILAIICLFLQSHTYTL
jgi:hypothetical protein